MYLYIYACIFVTCTSDFMQDGFCLQSFPNYFVSRGRENPLHRDESFAQVSVQSTGLRLRAKWSRQGGVTCPTMRSKLWQLSCKTWAE